MRNHLTLITIISLVAIGCGVNSQYETSTQHLKKPDSLTIPADALYTVIDTNTLRGIKRSLDVRLNRKVSKETLRTIALELKSQDSREYDRTFMVYYLPHMAIDAGAWATTHFNPDLKVRILGLTVHEEEKLVAEPVPANWEVIGQWLDEGPLSGVRITIFRENIKLFMEQRFKDGSGFKKELVEKKSLRGRRFYEMESSGFGNHWVIDSRENLEVRDNEGLIVTVKKIKFYSR